MTEPDDLVSMAEIARRAGVQRPAVSNWRRRYPDFPAAVRHSPRELFDAEAVAAWLARRKVPRNARTPSEPAGVTFGDRFRRNAGDGPDEQPTPVPRLPLAPGGQGAEEIAAILLRWLRRLPDFLDSAAYADVLLVTFYLRVADRENWARLTRTMEEHELTATLETILRRHMVAHPDRREFLHHFTWPSAESTGRSPVPELITLIWAMDEAGVLEPSATPAENAAFAARVYVELLDRIAARERHGYGEFPTPRPVAELVARLAEPGAADFLYDPCCGSGELLCAAVSRGAGPDGRFVVANALAHRPVLRAGMNLTLHNAGARLSANGFREVWEPAMLPLKADRIVSNPLFNVRPAPDAWYSDNPRWVYGVPPKHNANFAWLQHIAANLSATGRAVVIMPPSTTIPGDPAEHAIRTRMVEDGLVACVVQLPAGLFATTEIAVTVWVLEQGRPPGADVLLIDGGEADAQALGSIADAYERWRGGCRPSDAGVPARIVTVRELRDADHRLDPRAFLGSRQSETGEGASAERASRSFVTLDVLAQASGRVDRDVTALLLTIGADRDDPHAGGERVRLGDLCTVQMGPSDRIPLADAGNGVPMVTAAQIRDRRIQDVELEYAASDFVSAHPRYRLEPGDIVCVRTGLIDRTALVRQENAGWLVGRGCLLLRPQRDVHPSYLLHYLSHPQVVEWVLRSATAAVLPTISVRRLRELPVLLPPRAEQEWIAATLDLLDDQVAAHTAMVRASRQAHGRVLETLLPRFEPEAL